MFPSGVSDIKMRRLLFVAVLLLTVVSVTAFNFSVSVFPTERRILSNETAVFEAEIDHNSPVDETFEVYSNDVTWDVRPEQVLKVPVNGRLKSNILIRPLNLNPGAYNLPIMFKRTGSNDVQKIMLYLELSSPFPDDATYLPAVRGLATVSPQVDPRDGMTIKLSLENQNRRILDKVDVKVRSNVINKDYSTSLGPMEKKTLTFIADLDKRTPPQKDALQVSIIVPENEKAYQFDLFPVPYEVVPYGAVIPTVHTESSFLKYVDNVTLSNEGNKRLVHVYRVPAWFAKQWFVSGVPVPVKGGGELAWEVPMEPGQVTNVIVIYNYRPLFWLLIIAVIIAVAYYTFRSPISVKKRASVVSAHEGGITELKVMIELVNRGNKVARHVKVMDLVPKLTEVVKEFKETMLAPSKITPHEQSGTIVRWEIDIMDPKEHRILTYRMRTKLQVIGGMSLPVTAVRYLVEGKERESVSNAPEIRHRQ
jgi:hypothetical protein